MGSFFDRLRYPLIERGLCGMSRRRRSCALHRARRPAAAEAAVNEHGNVRSTAKAANGFDVASPVGRCAFSCSSGSQLWSQFYSVYRVSGVAAVAAHQAEHAVRTV